MDLSDRYIQDRFLPDKAVDLMDEAASRIRTRGLVTPPYLTELDQEIRKVRAEKKQAAKIQEYERAAVLRDRQADLEKELEEKQAQWRKSQCGEVTAENIAEVVSAWTKIPVTMLTEDETQQLRSLEKTLHGRVIGQDDAVSAVARAIPKGKDRSFRSGPARSAPSCSWVRQASGRRNSAELLPRSCSTMRMR